MTVAEIKELGKHLKAVSEIAKSSEICAIKIDYQGRTYIEVDGKSNLDIMASVLDRRVVTTNRVCPEQEWYFDKGNLHFFDIYEEEI